jgi:hypothetical protein
MREPLPEELLGGQPGRLHVGVRCELVQKFGAMISAWTL